MIAAGAGLQHDLRDLQLDRLMRGQARLIVSAAHRFAKRGWVNIADLEDERWIVGEADRSGPQFGAWPTLASDPNIVYTLLHLCSLARPREISCHTACSTCLLGARIT